MDIAAVNPVNAFRGFDAHEKLAAGAAGIGLFFAFWSWVGFEMAPNYGEESRDPKRIVPLSLYISVLALGIFYVTSPGQRSRATPRSMTRSPMAQTNSATFFFDPASCLIGNWVTVLMSMLILTGSFACGMAFHNTAARYLYSLGRERVLPGALGKTHPVHRTPHVASFTQSVIAAIIILIFAIKEGSGDPTTQAYLEVYGLMALVGTILIVTSQAVVSLAIIAYFRKHHPEDHHWWKTLIAPAIAFVTQAYVVYLCVANMDFLGGGLRFADYIIWIDLAVLVVGVLGAFYIKASDPEKYDKIGRLIDEGVPERP